MAAPSRRSRGPSLARGPDAEGRITPIGVMLLVVGLSIGLSTYEAFRVPIGPVTLQPYLVPLAGVVLVLGPGSLARMPRMVGFSLAAYVFVLVLVTLPVGIAVPEIAKAATLAATLWAIAIAPRNRNEVEWGVLGYSIAIAGMSIQAMASSVVTVEGVNPFEGIGTRTAYSLYSLPMLLIAGWFVLDATIAKRIRIALAVCMVITILTTFSTANRSGWLGTVVVLILLLTRGRRLRDVFAVVIIGSLAYWILVSFGSTLAFQQRLERTLEGNESDTFRWEIFQSAMRIGARSPLLGVSPQQVDREIGNDLEVGHRVDAHNVIGYVWAGGGVTLTAALVLILVSLWRRPGEWHRRGPPGPREARAHALLQMLVVLFLVRGMFTPEVITTPGFLIGFGFSLAQLLVSHDAEARDGAPLEPISAKPVRRGPRPPTKGSAHGRDGVRDRELPDLFAQERAHRHAAGTRDTAR